MANLLERLNKARVVGEGRYLACCPAHDDKSPSLSVRQLECGRTLIHCFAGCHASDVMAAIGMSLADLYPDRQASPGSLPDWKRRQLEEAADNERLIIRIVRSDMMKGQSNHSDMDRACLAMERLKKIQGVLAHG
jgi:hypothetical protein